MPALRFAMAPSFGMAPAAIVIALAALTAPVRAQDYYQFPSKVDIAWNQLYDYDQVTEILKKLAAAYPDMLKLESIGKSVQGRDMWAMTLNIEETGPHSSKPAMYIDANIHGNEVQGTEVVLYTIWYLTKSYGKVDQLTELMDRTAFYFIPMVNPDGRAWWFGGPNDMHSSRSGQDPIDNDGDGQFDEDPPNDLDGDGHIVNMRREDPNGDFRESFEDPRIMVRVEPQAKGDFKRYTMMGDEGIDDDGDGRINEDGPGGYDPNRNWPADWQPNYIQFGSHEYPLSLPESKSIADFALARPNIAAAQSFHNSGGMILRGPGANYVGYPGQDIGVYDRIGRRGEAMLPFYRYMIIWQDLYTVHGGTVNWFAEDLGVISFTNELWADRQYYPQNSEGPNQQQRMDFNDYLLFGQEFVPWKKVQHPVYGEIEIGGYRKMTGRVPPSFNLEELCHRNFAFTMYHAEQMPLVEMRDAEVRPADSPAAPGRIPPAPGNAWRVRVDVHNLRSIPTTTAQAALRHYGPRDYIEITGDNVKVAAGGTIRDRFTAPFEFVEHNPQRLFLDRGIPGDDHVTFQWIVTGSGKATVRFVSARAKDVEVTVELR